MNDNKKNEWVAALASFFIAGWGQVYNGESWEKGFVFFFIRILVFVCCILLGVLTFSQLLFVIGFFSLIILWIPIAFYDAYVTFSTTRKMNVGEIPFKKTVGLAFWGYPIPIILWTAMIFTPIIIAFIFGMAWYECLIALQIQPIW